MSTTDLTPSERIDALIAGIADWRGKTFADLRQTILDAQAGIVEEWKWMGSPVWSCDGMIAVANAHKGKVKLTFMRRAAARSRQAVQRWPRRQCAARDRFLRRRQARQASAEESGARGDRLQPHASEEEHPASGRRHEGAGRQGGMTRRTTGHAA